MHNKNFKMRTMQSRGRRWRCVSYL